MVAESVVVQTKVIKTDFKSSQGEMVTELSHREQIKPLPS